MPGSRFAVAPSSHISWIFVLSPPDGLDMAANKHGSRQLDWIDVLEYNSNGKLRQQQAFFMQIRQIA